MSATRDIYLELQHLFHRRELIFHQYERRWRGQIGPDDLALEREAALEDLATRMFTIAEDVAADTPTHPLIKMRLLEELAERASSDIVHRLALSLCADLDRMGQRNKWLRDFALTIDCRR